MCWYDPCQSQFSENALKCWGCRPRWCWPPRMLRAFSLSLSLLRVPTLCKTSCLVFRPKTAQPSGPNDFKPVALTSHLMKVLGQLRSCHHLTPFSLWFCWQGSWLWCRWTTRWCPRLWTICLKACTVCPVCCVVLGQQMSTDWGAELDSQAALWEIWDNVSRLFRGSMHEYKEQ